MHRFIPDPDRPAPTVDPSHTQAIKRWTRELLALPDDAVVAVNELACVDAGCPLVETIVTVSDAPGRTRGWRFTRPRAAITRLLVQQSLASAPNLPQRSPQQGVDTPPSQAPE